MGTAAGGYVELGSSWRPLGLLVLAGGLLVVASGVVLDGGVALWVALGAAVVLGLGAAGVLAARRAWTVRVGRGADGVAVLSLGRERVPLAEIDTAHLRAVREGRAGADAGARLLGGAGSLPRGRSGLPLRLIGGRTVLVPTRDPAALGRSVLAAVGDGGGRDGFPGPEGTLAR